MKLTFVCSLLLSLLIVGSKNTGKIDPEVQSFLGSQLVVRGEMRARFDSVFQNNDYLMVMYLATAECVPCSLNVINKLKYHQQLFRDVRTGQCLLVQDTSERSGVAELIASFDFPFPTLFDADDAILRENPVLSNALAKTFIMDREYNIIWVGSPIQNEKSLELYTKMMYKLCTLD